MSLEPDQAGTQSHSHPQCQAHPIPLYESNNYIYLCSEFTIVTLVVTFSLDQSTFDSLLEPNV